MARAEKRLTQIFSSLPAAERDMLLAFAEFLQARVQPEAEPLVPRIIARPQQESVVAAIKRLAATYPMLDKAVILNQTSALMTQHVMYGREAAAVIDDLEILFVEHYQRFQQESGE